MATAARATVANAHQVVARLAQQGQAADDACVRELDVLASSAQRMMRRLAPKWRTALTHSIHVSTPAPTVREIRPGVAYAEAVERGVRPGGKGLPRFFDPASADVVAWLRSKAFAGVRAPRRGSRAMQSLEMALRDRYAGLAWHVRHKGLRAQPFVAPTAQAMETEFPRRMALAVQRALAAGGAGGGAA